MGERWMEEHRRDPYTKRARGEGYRSRAAFKLKQINKRFRVLHRGDVVLDLGCAPGGWSQVALETVGPQGLVVGVDLDAVEPMGGFIFVRGDLSMDVTKAAVRASLGGRRANVVISDMAPNISGTYGLDHFRSMQLARLTVEFGAPLLVEGGHIVVKVFEGELVPRLVGLLRTRFARVKPFRPEATRKASSEVYLVALGHDGKGAPEWRGFPADEDEVSDEDADEGGA